MKTLSDPYRGHRFPAEIIAHTVWLYLRFTLSFRDIDELLAARSIFVTYETIRQWTLKFGQLWRAVDQEGYTRMALT
jgi:putative transposase